MRKRSLHAAITAAIIGSVGIANASLYLNPDGTGQLLLYPYYTVNNELQTLVSIVNTTDSGKAVKVRFLEGRNSREVLDFNLYLSPFDVWVAAITSSTSSSTAPARLITNDRSCTAPTIPAGGVDFRNFAYAFPPDADSGPTGLERTREGYIEVIEMGRVTNEAAPSTFTPLTWITHVSGTPANCPRIIQSWLTGGEWLASPNRAIRAPNGGLFGNASIVDVAEGVMYSYAAEAIDDVRVTPNHQRPGTIRPSIDEIDTAPSNTSIVFYNGTALNLGYANAIDVVSSVITHSALLNEYHLDPALAAETEWVVTFPTKGYYVDSALYGLSAPIQPFQRLFPPAGFTGPGVGRSCVDVRMFIYDREEAVPRDQGDGGIDFSPPPPETDGPQLCFETQVITFNQGSRFSANQPSQLLGSRLYTNVEASNFGFSNGWMRLEFSGALRTSEEGFIVNGLPAIGFAVMRYTNRNAQPGILAQYSGLWRHRAERLIFSR